MSSRDPRAESLVFDRAPDYYDRTRALPEEAMAEVVTMLVAELRDKGNCLEIGVGTGRMALPLAGQGVELVGLDLSTPMLERLRRNAGGREPFPLVIADATRQPFAGASFATALAVHVFHLIPDWREAVAEVVRVVRPGGNVLVEQGNWAQDLGREIDDRFCAAAGIEKRHRGANQRSEIDEAFGGFGASVRSLPGVVARFRRTLEERIADLEEGLFSFTWGANESDRRRAAQEVRQWARAAMGPLEEERDFEALVELRAYDLP